MTHPARLGKYEVIGVIGEGAMGVVYRGFDPDIRRTVALKTIRRPAGESSEAAAEMAARFRNEAQAAGRLQHPGIVGVYDFGDDGRVAFIAMEFVEGQSLAHYLRQQVWFSDADLASVIGQVLDALHHAHEHGVWHRDIKPANVIMTRAGTVKIADFGIARIDSAGLTMGAAMIGTPAYMAPEQFLGQPIDRRVDVYGAGVLMYQLIAGRAPFVGSTEALMYQVVHQVPAPASQSAAQGRSSRFDAIVAKALAKRPDERFATAAAFREAVAAVAGVDVPAAVSEQTVFAVPSPAAHTPTVRVAGSAAGARSAASASAAHPSHWEPATLAQAESSLAKYLGPLAGVLVRRAARECVDLPSLYARLAEQIPDADARGAFLGLASRSASGTAKPGGGSGVGGAGSGVRSGMAAGSMGSSASGGAAVRSAPVSDATLAQVQQLLALQLGPIARVVVRKAAERTRERDPLFAALVEAVPESGRAALRAALAKLV